MPRVKKKRSLTQYRVFASYRRRDRRSTTRVHMGRRTLKRGAIRLANSVARGWMAFERVHPRQVSVYMVPPGQKRGRLLYQVHFSPKLKRLIVEEL